MNNLYNTKCHVVRNLGNPDIVLREVETDINHNMHICIKTLHGQ